MDSTMDRINQLSNERHQLWVKGGRSALTDKEYWRLQQISRELAHLWDTYRRQRAAIAWNGRSREADGRARDTELLARAA